ncbi:MAG: ribonuclease E inhibitor RraB [Rheinheimera sp.]|nr:ribonuclease E inhibitor RraB [Rheinheimera sp.]
MEKVAVEVFKLGFEVTDAEEVEFEDGGSAWVFDAIREQSLDAESITKDAIKLEALAQQFGVEYDGWGTYFEGDEEFGRRRRRINSRFVSVKKEPLGSFFTL